MPRSVLLLYKVVMPVITLLFLLVIPQFIQHPAFMGSGVFDFIVRGLLCLWFCLAYSMLPNIKEKYGLYPNITWSKADISPAERFLFIGFATFFSICVVLITLWTIGVFVPIISKYGLLLAITNGAIFLIPLSLQYEVFKL